MSWLVLVNVEYFEGLPLVQNQCDLSDDEISFLALVDLMLVAKKYFGTKYSFSTTLEKYFYYYLFNRFRIKIKEEKTLACLRKQQDKCVISCPSLVDPRVAIFV